jgi:hypothetical protein
VLRLERPPAVCRWGRQHSARAPLSGVSHPAQPEAARRGGPAERLARSSWYPRQAASEYLQQPAASGCPRQGASSVRRHAAVVPSSCFRPAGLPAESWVELAESASRSAPAVAWRPMAEAAAPEMASPSGSKVAEWAQPVASALRALLPPAEAACGRAAQPLEVAARSGATVQPPEGAGAASDASAEPQQVVAAEPDAVPQPAAAVVRDAGVALRPEAAARGAEGLRPEAAVAVRGAEVVPRPEEAAGALLVLWARQPAAERPSAAVPFVCLPLPWPGPRRGARSAHGMRRSRAALPSGQLWQAARCGGLS